MIFFFAQTYLVNIHNAMVVHENSVQEGFTLSCASANSIDSSIKISIVIPVYYSEDCLNELATQVASSVSVGYELILVDDGSRDNSWNVIKRLVKTDPNVRGIRLRRNYGQDNAIMAGLRCIQGNYAVIMDDDLQHSPSDIMKLYEACTNDYDVCYANFEAFYHRSWKRWGSRLNGKMAEILLGKPADIYLSPFKIIRRDVVEEICTHSGPYPYVDGLIFDHTQFITQINVGHHTRYAGKSTYSFIRSMRVWCRHATGFSVKPLRFATLGGFLFAMIGFGFGVYSVVEYFLTGGHVPGWASLVCAILLFGGINLTCTGMVGEYVGRNYMNVSGKSQYSIRETEGSSSCPPQSE
jgi:undecaprenyl-phosphate 4-deoxy-4-formamido-L-arabinose transferase